ncbi:DNA glycosylase [Daldinia caldariorum]|uniref:DNA glycosylase n=1 Tax=Daldinia caldariorum TaxID=326644 RepID=UPI002008AE0F|nr:DNA glycosylase [Daldinia caldariorum]KAI1471802.1 DNA glycosylase [Daldinia caldariorum]
MADATVKSEADSVGKPITIRRSARNAGKNGVNVPIKQENLPANVATPPANRQRKRVRVKNEDEEETGEAKPVTKSAKRKAASTAAPSRVKAETLSPRKDLASRAKKGRSKEGSKDKGTDRDRDKEEELRAKKLKSYSQFANTSPYPDFPQPTPEECQRAYDVLAKLHGERKRPEKVLSAPRDRAGCGDSPSVLDALVRTVLSQNTSNSNSARAKLDMDAEYGGSDSEERWGAIASGGAARLEKAIARGGLGGVKSRVIVDILNQVKLRYGKYSLDHLLEIGLEARGGDDDDERAMRELLSFRGVGPKTASCVLLFCVGRASFAVDTHVHRLTGMMGWRPGSASRDEAFSHLDARVPDPLKYGLHVLLIEHGRTCAECKAGGKSLGKCELRQAFKRKSRDGEEEMARTAEEKSAKSEEDGGGNGDGK